MPQKTNLNIGPYYDDFDKEKNYYKVLFKPGFPIQARELTTLQSTLQNQIESFGTHFFKEGSMVIPGSVTYDSNYYAVKINDQHLGIDVSVYIKDLVGKKIRGQQSNVTAVIDNYLLASEDGEVEYITLYVKYLNSGTDNETIQFSDDENLVAEENIIYGNTVIPNQSTIASTISLDATATGASVGISSGVYFIRGTFVDVSSDKIILDPYTNTPSYRVGLTIVENIVNSKEDNTLYDNAKGFSNFAAPGADRLQISTFLSKKSLDDFEDKNFIELVKLENGEIKKLQNKSEYSEIKDYFAKRTYEESGDYTLDRFDIEVTNSLNDGISSNGLYFEGQTTSQGNIPSENLMCVKVSPGKAYIRGYDVELLGTTVIDVEKPRDIQTVPSTLVPFNFGHVLRVNNVFGTPYVGINEENNYVTLYKRRKNSNNTQLSSSYEIGRARVYSYNLTDSPYTSNATNWDLNLFDIQTYTYLTVNSEIPETDCPSNSYVQGLSSGASGYVLEAPTSNTLRLIQTSGSFIQGEQISVNGSNILKRSVELVESYGIQDVKSVFQNAVSLGLSSNFIADTVLEKTLPPRFGVSDTVTISIGGTVTSAGGNFAGIKKDSIVRYQLPGNLLETFNRVVSISSDNTEIQLAAVPSVANVCSGVLPSTEVTTSIQIGSPKIISSNDKLYFNLPTKNISSVNLNNSSLTVKAQVNQLSTDVEGNLISSISNTGITSAFFVPFDTERYSVIYSDGTVENLTSDQVSITNGGSNINITGLNPGQSGNVTLNATVEKVGLQHKVKNYVRGRKLLVNKTIIGENESVTGLTTSNYYGLRVQDREISLNVPDAAKVIGIFESLDEQDPFLDRLTFITGLNLDSSSVIGEKIVGDNSGAVAQLISKISSTTVEICYLNSLKFIPGETVTFKESNIRANIQQIEVGKYLNLTDSFTLDNGQRNQYYDYSRIVRNSFSRVPSRRLLVVFDYYEIPANDRGDLYTVNSYPFNMYGDETLSFAEVRNSDILDFRPRVSEFNSINTSPFSFTARNFGNLSQNNATLVIAPNESSVLGYSHYLPRIDKVVLNKLGELSVIKGVSSTSPAEPTNVEEAITLGLINLPPYLYKPTDASIQLIDNKRYTMREIGKIEGRVEKLEVQTSLSLLELTTKTLQIQDADGLSRFKTGFFADPFENTSLIDIENPDAKCDIDTEKSELTTPIEFYTIKPEIALSSGLNPESADFTQNLALLDSNARKTGDLITLAYNEVGWLEQPFATRVENINPFNMILWVGRITLTPSSDTWVRTVYLNNGTRTVLGDRNMNYVENILISRTPERYIRSRNIKFSSVGLKPFTRYYSFFDGNSRVDIVPKLLEIQMTSGIFRIGETVDGFIGGTKVISFRLCQLNHKSGPYNAPTKFYTTNPYDRTLTISPAYSASSTLLNVDISSLSEEVIGKFSGYVTEEVTLIGKTSLAQAKVSNVRLISDVYGYIEGSIFIRNPLSSPPPPVRFLTGRRTFKLTSSPTDELNTAGSLLISSGETTYLTSGRLDVFRQTNVVVRVPPPPPAPPQPGRPPIDPLAQTFTVDETGAFLSSVDLYFASKDENENVTIELRTVELGTPTNQLVQDFATVTLEPSQINISDNASLATRVTFPSPIYLQPNTEYALVLLSPSSDNYEMWIGRFGETTVETQNLPNAEAILMTRQYLGGSLFKSQNGTIWTANQNEDLKFKLYKCSFANSGVAYFYNPDLNVNDSNVSPLIENPITTYPRKIKVGIETTTNSSIINSLSVGTRVGRNDSFGTNGYIEKVGSAINTTSIFNVGVGYSNGTFFNVPLFSVTGNGEGAVATLQFTDNKLSSVVSITNSGSGYSQGDVLGITTSAVNKGTNGYITVSSINGIDTLYLTNVQGEQISEGDELIRYADNGTLVTSPAVLRGTSSVINPLYEGNVISIENYNHGMHADNNIVKIEDVTPDTFPTVLTQPLSSDATVISVASTLPFSTFEGVPSSQGYLKINNEIIFYSGIGDGILAINERGVDGSLVRSHERNSVVYKYELNGISLTRINTTHQTLPNNSYLKSLRDIDTFHLQIDRGTRTVDNQQLSFTSEKICGGSEAKTSKNIQFNSIVPQVNVITPGQSTRVVTQLRTVSATSCAGSEISFIDQGFENIELNQNNELPTTRMVCSRVNEIGRLQNLPRNKSLTLTVAMQSNDSNLSPVIDTSNMAMVFGRYKLNNPVSNYVYDNRVNLVKGDPHSGIYVSKRVDLSQPATSLKVYLTAYRDSTSDFRVLYRLFKPDSDNISQNYNLFPGYDNLIDLNGDGFGDIVIDPFQNTGNPDAFTRSSVEGEFLEYQYTVDNLEQFTGFAIKIVLSGTNEARPPKFKDIRVIALA